MSSVHSLIASITAGATLETRLEALIQGLAARIKATSNDQNIQRLSCDLAAAAPEIVRVVIAADAHV